MIRPIRTVLAPAEACNRVHNALRSMYGSIINVRNAKDRAGRIEQYEGVMQASELVDDAFASLRYAVLKEIFSNLQSMNALAKKDPRYLGAASEAATKAKKYFDESKKGEYDGMKKCHFLRKESYHLWGETRKMESSLRGLMNKQLRIIKRKEIQEKQEERNLKREMKGKGGKNPPQKIIKGNFEKQKMQRAV